jgi:hypothetical protein
MINAKRNGTIYEQKFLVEAMEHGLEPHPTIGDYLAHDMLVSNAAGRAFRTQIKGTTTRDPNRKMARWQMIAGQGRAKRPLDCSKVDILAAYVDPIDAWYIIPCMRIKSPTLWFSPGTRGQYEVFMNNWDYFLD